MKNEKIKNPVLSGRVSALDFEAILYSEITSAVSYIDGAFTERSKRDLRIIASCLGEKNRVEYRGVKILEFMPPMSAWEDSVCRSTVLSYEIELFYFRAFVAAVLIGRPGPNLSGIIESCGYKKCDDAGTDVSCPSALSFTPAGWDSIKPKMRINHDKSEIEIEQKPKDKG